MQLRPMGKMVLSGVGLCGLFAVAFAFGGWLYYGLAAGCALLVCMVAGIGLKRTEARLHAALDRLVRGDEPLAGEENLLGGAMGPLSEALSAQREAADFCARAFRALAGPALLSDAEGHIRQASRPLLALLHKTEDQAVGQTVSRAFYDRDGVSVTEKALRTMKPVAESLDLKLWDGRVVPVQLFVDFIRDDAGATLGAVASLLDLSEQAARQREIETQRERLREAGQHISGLAEHVASATELLSASADEQAQGAQKQRRQTASVAASMEEMTGTVLEVARHATVTSEAATEANTSAEEGAAMVDDAVAAINQVAESARQLGLEIVELDSQAGAIGQIINVINDIADQTNLLALNAAIEAARAGDAGRGFAVVADEVRKLAEKTMDATKEVEEAVVAIQKRSKDATNSMQATAAKVGESTALSNRAGESLQRIMDNIRDMVQRVAQIATAAEEQSSAVEGIMRSVGDIASIAEDADEAAGQAAGATREMAELARELLDVSREFGDGETGTSDRLRSSDGQMRGVLPKLAQEYVRKTHGQALYEAMQRELGNPVFLPADSYPDQVLRQMAEFAADGAGISVREFFIGLGRYTVVRFNELYPGYFKKDSLKDFYLRMNDVHAQLTKSQPGIKPPKFTYEDKGDVLFMNYRSSRGLFDYFEGILLGAADFKGERVEIAVKPFDDQSARAEIKFLGAK
ncbi:methyl-accepting chemotaxis protein [Desulfovibrio sp. Huiquan2017]|uniref:methyl-accepting chemotaxis protein n=1 Tax=Desulfovibrio sp. Huiquan2017 TaxID=2816861 RepID=UPI001A9103A6|nr:methyl-accepting chemotaxis protein [Desulfovibrio sp. Huiquan2017]